jgi:hypothetical protein
LPRRRAEDNGWRTALSAELTIPVGGKPARRKCRAVRIEGRQINPSAPIFAAVIREIMRDPMAQRPSYFRACR